MNFGLFAASSLQRISTMIKQEKFQEALQVPVVTVAVPVNAAVPHWIPYPHLLPVVVVEAMLVARLNDNSQ